MRAYLEHLSALAARFCLTIHSIRQSGLCSDYLARAPKSLDLTYYVHECRQHNYPYTFVGEQLLTVRQCHSGMSYNFYKSYTDLDGPASLRIAGDKIHCYQVMQSLRIPIPRHITVRSSHLRQVLEFKNTCGKGIVIKPARNTGDAAGVAIRPEGTCHIFRALQTAAAYHSDILVEEYCEGANYRLLFCHGEFLAASERLPASVTGDGCRFVADLIRAANSRRRDVGDLIDYSPATRPILYKIPCDRRIAAVLRKQGLCLNSVPPQGQTVQLQDVCHWLWGGEYHDVTDRVCPTLIEAAARLVQTLGVKLAGVDVITSSIGDCRNGDYVINEVNTTPALLVHYEVQNREKMRPVGHDILRRLFEAP